MSVTIHYVFYDHMLHTSIDLAFSKLKLQIIFEVPEVRKEVTPEKKVPVAPPKKPEAPPAKGMCPYMLLSTCIGLGKVCSGVCPPVVLTWINISLVNPV